jgi:hypothetical protein
MRIKIRLNPPRGPDGRDLCFTPTSRGRCSGCSGSAARQRKDQNRFIVRSLSRFRLVEYSGVLQILAAVKTDAMDMRPTAANTVDHEIIMDFSNPYCRSGLAIAVSTEDTGFNWLGLIERFYASHLFPVMG